ncbi:hypothetical protein IF2G_01739 [Cordyceps javanica]|nr:hypothetical protein IF2G_01739 [Cordyceps javanica]
MMQRRGGTYVGVVCLVPGGAAANTNSRSQFTYGTDISKYLSSGYLASWQASSRWTSTGKVPWVSLAQSHHYPQQGSGPLLTATLQAAFGGGQRR